MTIRQQVKEIIDQMEVGETFKVPALKQTIGVPQESSNVYKYINELMKEGLVEISNPNAGRGNVPNGFGGSCREYRKTLKKIDPMNQFLRVKL